MIGCIQTTRAISFHGLRLRKTAMHAFVMYYAAVMLCDWNEHAEHDYGLPCHLQQKQQ